MAQTLTGRVVRDGIRSRYPSVPLDCLKTIKKKASLLASREVRIVSI